MTAVARAPLSPDISQHFDDCDEAASDRILTWSAVADRGGSLVVLFRTLSVLSEPLLRVRDAAFPAWPHVWLPRHAVIGGE